jgi:diacylglycerol kinase family enzyme
MDTIAQPLKPQTRPAPLLCLLNGSAGSDRAEVRREEIRRAFDALGCAVEIVSIHDGEPIAAPARKAVARGDAIVIAGGGDGTMSAVANALAGTRTALAVLPLGTLNHFAKDLGIPLQLEAAVANVVNGAMRAVDVAEVNGRVFINNSSIGLYPAIVRERETLQKDGRSKWIAFAEALLGVLKGSRSIRVRLKSPVESLSTRTEFVFVGNNAYDLAPPRIAGRNRLDEGVLWVWRLPHTGRFRAVLAALHALFADPKSKTPLAFTANELSIAMRRKHIDVALDGEVIAMQTPLRYRARPQSLRVIVPAQSS